MKYLSASLFLVAILASGLARAEPVPDLAPIEPPPCAPTVAVLPPAPPETRMRSPGLVGGGVGLIFGGLATIAGGVGVVVGGSMEANSDCCGSSGPYPAVQALGVAIAALGLGGVVGGVVMIASGAKSVPDDEAPPRREARIEPFFRAGAGNATAGFRF